MHNMWSLLNTMACNVV